MITLARALLVSTSFISSFAYADLTISTSQTVSQPFQTAIDGNITLANTGQVITNGAAGEAFLINSNSGTATVIVDTNNIYGALAIHAKGTDNGITFNIPNRTFGLAEILPGSGITSDNGNAIYIVNSDGNALINNYGILSGGNDGIKLSNSPLSFINNLNTISGEVYSIETDTISFGTNILNIGILNGNILLGGGNILSLNNNSQVNGSIILQNGANDIFWNGGSFNQIQGGNSDSLNIYDTLTSYGPIEIGSININNPLTIYTVNGGITNLNNTFTINVDTTVTANSDISGTGAGTNAGNLILANGQLTLNTFTSNAGSVVQLQLANNEIVVTGGGVAATFAQGSIIMPLQIMIGTFDVVSATGAGSSISDSSILLPSNNNLVTLRKFVHGAPGAQTLRIVSTPTSALANATVNDSTLTGIAQTITQFLFFGSNNGDIQSMIFQLNSISAPDIEASLGTILPPFNYGLVESSIGAMNLVFNMISSNRFTNAVNGIGYGDFQTPLLSMWAEGFGGNIEQNWRQNTPGYTARGAGGVVGLDFELGNCALLGISGSYSRFNVADKSIASKNVAVENRQATLYGWYEPTQDIFIDAMVALSFEDFASNRPINIGAINTAAQGDFGGTQYGALLDVGYQMNKIMPMIRIKYFHLEIPDYIETGAGGLNLIVNNQSLNELAGGVGFETTTTYHTDEMTWVPAASIFALYDFVTSGQTTFANFTGGGVGFSTNGVPPGRGIVDLELGLSVFSHCLGFTATYDLEIRDKFTANAGFLQLTYLM